MRKGGEVARAPQGLSAAENQTQPCVRNRDGCSAAFRQTLPAGQQRSKMGGCGRLLPSSIYYAKLWLLYSSVQNAWALVGCCPAAFSSVQYA